MRQQLSDLRSRSLLALCTALCAVLVHQALAPIRALASERTTTADLGQLQATVDALRARLSIRQGVIVSIVPTNRLLMSVEAPTDPSEPFRLAIEGAFLHSLTELELEAALAHELGHVWIFTHAPHQQTEQFANEIALRLVSRPALRRVYQKVWLRGGTTVPELAAFLDSPPALGLATDDRAK
jgi:hypothetical protein